MAGSGIARPGNEQVSGAGSVGVESYLSPSPPLPIGGSTSPPVPLSLSGEGGLGAGPVGAGCEPPLRLSGMVRQPGSPSLGHMLRHRIDRLAYPDREKLAISRRLRQNPTPAERHAWSLLRNRGILGFKFRRQHVLQGFIVDFYCASLRLVLELDGAPHDNPAQASYDAARAVSLEAHGYRVRRLPNRDVSREGLERLLQPYLSRRSSS